jgi:hypothetical protein
MERLFVKYLNHKTGTSIRNPPPGTRPSLFLRRAVLHSMSSTVLGQWEIGFDKGMA